MRRRAAPGRAATARVAALLLPAAAGAALLSGCSEGLPATQGLTGTVRVDGSSSVTPLVAAGVTEFGEQVEPGVVVRLRTSGTGAGIERLCAGEVDVAMASRPLTEPEAAACEAAGVRPVDVALGNDAVVVVVPARNPDVRCLTTEELRRLWQAGGDAPATWAELRPGLPGTALVLLAPGEASGTADVFVERVLDGAPLRDDVARSEDDEVIVQGVAASPGGVGVVPLSYATASEEVRAVAVDSGEGCVAPTPRTVADGSYGDLVRELHVHVSATSYEQSRSVRAFADYLVRRADGLAEATGAVRRTEAQRALGRDALAALEPVDEETPGEPSQAPGSPSPAP